MSTYYKRAIFYNALVALIIALSVMPANALTITLERLNDQNLILTGRGPLEEPDANPASNTQWLWLPGVATGSLGFVVNGGDFAINGKDLKTGYFTNSGEIRLAFSLALAVDDIPTGSENLSFFTNVFSPVGTTGDVLWGNLGDNSIVGRYEIVAAPIPAAVPLFATALAGIGVIGWLRRKAA